MSPFPLWANVLAVLAGLVVGVLDARRLRRRHPGLGLQTALRHARYLYAAPVLLVGLGAAHYALQGRADLWWSLPTWLEVRWLGVIWGAILAVFALLFGLALALAFAERHGERWKALVAALLCIGAVEHAVWKFSRPVAPDLRDEVRDGVVLQTSGVTCAAASAANLLRATGRPATEREMAAAFGTTTLGTSAGQVVEGLRALGYACDKVEVADASALPLPAILFVDHAQAGPEGHAVALMAAAERVEVWDPLVGRVLQSRSDLARVWRGRAVACRF